MKFYEQLTAPILANPIPKSKTVFDDSKVTDHHAIIPTEVLPTGIHVKEEKLVYDLIAKRFISVFYPECKVSNTTVLGMVGQVEFKATGKQILEPGWRLVYANEPKKGKEKEEERLMPTFEVGEKGPHEPKIHQGKTSPPKAYTEATLLRAMETAGKQVEDEEMREMLKENGIGRPSTRANIIETLYKRKYIEKKKKNIFATQTGIDLIDTIENDLLKSPELTGVWERKLRQIEKGEYDPAVFKNELIQMVVDLTVEVKNSHGRRISIVEEVVEKPAEKPKKKAPKKKVEVEELSCPKCKEHKLIKGKAAYGCGNFKVCGFKLSFEVFGKKLTSNQIQDLIDKGKTRKIKGLNLPDGASKEGKVSFDSAFNLQVED
jgi:DNA topoisomerase III